MSARRVRAGAILTAVAAATLAVAPVLPWFATRVAGDTVRASGLEGAGELWILPLLGVLALGLLSLGALGARGDRDPATPATGIGLAALGALGLLWSLRSLLDPPAVLRTPALPQPVPAPISLEPAALAAPVAATVLVVMGVLVARPWLWRPS